jgi:hypothetical protein
MDEIRLHCRGAATAALLLSFAAMAPAAGAADAAPDLAGVYWATEYRPQMELVGGGELPFTEAGRAAYDRNLAGLADGTVVDAARKFCTPDGPVRSLATPYPFEIVQAPPGQVLFLHELNHAIRFVTLDRPLPAFEEVIAYPWHSGHSVGRYEGDTLVIETIGFNPITYLDATGVPHSFELVTTERVRKIGPTELEIVVTVHDPQYFTEDWQARFVYEQRDDVRLEGYLCGGEHRDISHIPGVTEARETWQARHGQQP